MSPLRWLLSAFGYCAHAHRIRERQHGRLMLTCEACGHSTPAVARSQAEARHVLSGVHAGERRATVKPKPKKARQPRFTLLRKAANQ